MGENGNPDAKITFLTCFSFIHIVSSALVLRVMDWWWLFVLLYSKPDSVDQDPTLLKSVCRASSSSLDLISLYNWYRLRTLRFRYRYGFITSRVYFEPAWIQIP